MGASTQGHWGHSHQHQWVIWDIWGCSVQTGVSLTTRSNSGSISEKEKWLIQGLFLPSQKESPWFITEKSCSSFFGSLMKMRQSGDPNWWKSNCFYFVWSLEKEMNQSWSLPSSNLQSGAQRRKLYRRLKLHLGYFPFIVLWVLMPPPEGLFMDWREFVIICIVFSLLIISIWLLI